MTHNFEYFAEFVKFETCKYVRIGDGTLLKAVGQGKINVMVYGQNKWSKRYLDGVLYVPDMKVNLFSTSSVLDKGYTMKSDSNKCMFFKDRNLVVVGFRESGLFEVKMKVIKPDQTKIVNYAAKNDLKSLTLWHQRLVHQNIVQVKDILKRNNIKFTDDLAGVCEGCCYGKQHRVSHKSSSNRATCKAELLHVDLCGPMEQLSVGGSKYGMLIKDDFSRFKWVYFLKQKSEVKDNLKEFIISLKNQETRIKAVRTDNGLEFCNHDVSLMLQNYGIEHQRSVVYTPEQNGTIEREIRTTTELARSLLCSKGLEKHLWAEAMNTVVYVMNRAGPSGEAGKTPYELWFHKTADISHFKVFGSSCFVHTPKQHRKKWDAKSTKAIFVGYDKNPKAFRVYFPLTNKIEILCDVVFGNEIDILKDNSNTTNIEEIIVKIPEANRNEVAVENSMDDTLVDVIEPETNAVVEEKKKEYNLRSKSKLSTNIFDMFVSTSEIPEPSTYEEAMKTEHFAEWQEAMDIEYESLMKNKVWVLCEMPPGRKLVDCRWVFKVKQNTDGSIERFKARLVARGFSQVYGIDYEETFFPAVKSDSIRLLLSHAVNRGMFLKQFDIKTAFLYGILEEEIFMKQPPGYVKDFGKVCKLERSLYGLKQSPRCFNKKFQEVLDKFEMKVCKSDSCVYVKNVHEKKLILAIYVDDGLLLYNDEQLANDLLQHLYSNFEMTECKIDKFLGFQIKQKDGSLFLHQTQYTLKILKRFNMIDCSRVLIPMDDASSFSTNNTDTPEKFPYRELIGSLLYLSIISRPDISFAVGVLSRYLEKPLSVHISGAKRILRYLKGTFNYGLMYTNDLNELKIYSDSDYAGDPSNRKSTSGVAVKYGSCTIAWRSQLQKSVTLSTTEAEYVAAAEAVKDVIWIKRLLSEISTTPLSNCSLLLDNQSAIKLIKNPEFHKRTKHIDVRYHFIRDRYEEGIFKLSYVCSQDQLADILTKALPSPRFNYIRNLLNLVVDTDYNI